MKTKIVNGDRVDEANMISEMEVYNRLEEMEREKMRVSMGSVHGKSFTQCLSGNENRNYTTENKIKN
ncbi:MAG TPA: hypothetical protein ENI15_20990 [Spirochaetes bacterium]|nr:hypothetical protein [Spirochaetota bacterium]